MTEQTEIDEVNHTVAQLQIALQIAAANKGSERGEQALARARGYIRLLSQVAKTWGKS